MPTPQAPPTDLSASFPSPVPGQDSFIGAFTVQFLLEGAAFWGTPRHLVNRTNHSFFQMNIPQRDISTAEAGKLVLAKLDRVLRGAKAPQKLIQAALIPVFGIRWDAQVIKRITRNRLCEILYKLRNSKLDAPTYRRVSLSFGSRPVKPSVTFRPPGLPGG